MKRSSTTTLALNTTTPAQKTRKYKEISITKSSEVINVSAEKLWAIARDFGNVGVWTSTLNSSEGVGAPEFEGATYSERVCHTNIKGFSEVHEKLTMFNDANKELSYKVSHGLPGFVLLAQNHWTILEVGPNQSMVSMNSYMRLTKFMGFLLGGKMRKTALKALDTVLAELKIYAETGEVAETKKAQLKKQSRIKKKRA